MWHHITSNSKCAKYHKHVHVVKFQKYHNSERTILLDHLWKATIGGIVAYERTSHPSMLKSTLV